jgi:hypothetical protein
MTHRELYAAIAWWSEGRLCKGIYGSADEMERVFKKVNLQYPDRYFLSYWEQRVEEPQSTIKRKRVGVAV